MLDILKAEGWDLKEREFIKLRKEHNLLLRAPNKTIGRGQGSQQQSLGVDELRQAAQQDEENDRAESAEPSTTSLSHLPPEIIAKRQARQARLLAESEERLKSRTRRRRTKVWSGLPPDPAAPPRYPSELTMEECKRELGLDKQLYQKLRGTFEEICRVNNIVKKTLCGPDTWKAVKEELIRREPHLQSIFWGPGATTVNQTQQPMALELLCTDVTKRIRTIGSRITISGAKNILALTPQEGRDVRSAFDAILKEDYFVSKLEVPREHWEGLKAKWVERSPLLQQRLSGGASDPDYATKVKCLESIAADVQKRHRDEQTKKDPSLTKSIDPANDQMADIAQTTLTSPSTLTGLAHDVPNTEPLPPFPPNENMVTSPLERIDQRHHEHENSQEAYRNVPSSNISEPSVGMTTLASRALASHPSLFDYGDIHGTQIDPSLLQAAALPQGIGYSSNQPSNNESIAIYFRMSPLSSTQYLNSHPRVWLDTLTSPYTVVKMKQLASVRAHEGTISVRKIEGVAPGIGDEGGSKWRIDEDDELEAYLEMVRSGKATFVVELE